MPTRTSRDLNQELKQGRLEPVYYLFGPEAFLREKAEEAIAEEALRDTLLREFNDSLFSLMTDEARDAVAIAEQLPMMSQRRVVRIRDFGKVREADEEVLVSYLERPVETSVVIFSIDEIDKRKRLAKVLSSSAAFEFQLLKPNELQSWIRSRLHELGAEIEPRAVQLMVETVASNLHTLNNELGKLTAAALPSGRITVDLVEELTTRSREHMNWELTDHLLAGNRKGALKTLKELLDDRVEPLLLIGLIAGTYRRLALAKELLAQGASSSKIFSEVRMPPFKQASYLSHLRRIDSAAVTTALQRIAEADLAIKTSKATPRMQVEMLVCELIR